MLSSKLQDPVQRWLNTPLEDEGISFSAVEAAVRSNEQMLQKRKADLTSDTEISEHGSEPLSIPVNDRGYDSVSMSGFSSANSASSNGSQASHGSWAGRKGRKRIKIGNRGLAPNSRRRQGARIFQCTWCCQGFERKDSWKRHEESEHCAQKEYVCMLYGPTQDSRILNLQSCVFCGSPNPSEAHLEGHRVHECYAKPEAERSFSRFDNLIQHIEQIHLSSYVRPPSQNTSHWCRFIFSSWRRPIPGRQTQWQCGFCPSMFMNWDQRATHIAKHFVRGEDMSGWIDTALHALPPPLEDLVSENAPLEDLVREKAYCLT